MIYGAILRRAARNARIVQIDVLRSAQDGFRAALRSGSVADRALANTLFHEITGDVAGNVYLLPLFCRLLIDHARIRMTFHRPRDRQMSDNLAKASRQHDAIIHAIAQGDEATAAGLAHEHWALSRDQIEMFVLPAELDHPCPGIWAHRPEARSSDPMGTPLRRIDSALGGLRIVTRRCATLRSGMEARGRDLARANAILRWKEWRAAAE